ncbi:MAG: hypothetical protein HS130_07410 [Deltaproteobacteria bacterium]|nr:hypothetical protein [Deltaproteobacteria bacterium]
MCRSSKTLTSSTAGLTRGRLGGYRYGPNGTASLSYTHSVYSFETERERIRTHGVMAGIEEAVSPTMSVNLSGGAEYATGLDGDDIFLTANAGIVRNLADRYSTVLFVRTYPPRPALPTK